MKITGGFGTRVQRPVRLQYWTGSWWASLASKSTTSSGDFAFRTRAVARSRMFRAHAPRVTTDGQTYQSATSDPRTVKTVTARASLSLVPAPIGQARAKASRTNLTPGVASFSPARKGRKVVVQRYGSGWSNVASGRQDSRGKFSFNTRARKGQIFRAVTVAADGAPKAKSAPARARRLDRTFNDTFSNGLGNWSVRMAGSRKGGGRKCSESSAMSVSVSSGRLLLQTKRIQRTDGNYHLGKELDGTCPHGQFNNGHVGTSGKFSFKHGIMAARIKMQPQRGHHGGFWSKPVTSHASGAEIDGVEYYGNNYSYKGEPAPIQHSIYRGSDTKAKVVKSRNYLLAADRKWSSDHHIFSVQWTPKRYIFRIDGNETFRTTRGVSQTDQSLILSLLSSDWELPHLPSRGPYTPMSVDWVRVWQY